MLANRTILIDRYQTTCVDGSVTYVDRHTVINAVNDFYYFGDNNTLASIVSVVVLQAVLLYCYIIILCVTLGKHIELRQVGRVYTSQSVRRTENPPSVALIRCDSATKKPPRVRPWRHPTNRGQKIFEFRSKVFPIVADKVGNEKRYGNCGRDLHKTYIRYHQIGGTIIFSLRRFSRNSENPRT